MRCAVSGLVGLVLAVSTLGAQPVAVGTTLERLAPRDLAALQTVREVQVSPDGQRIAYSVSRSDRPGRPYSEVRLLDLTSRRTTTLGGDAGASGPRWSPDGTRVAYVGREGDRRGVMVAQPDGSGARFLAEVAGTNHPLPQSGERLAWSPDSTQLAFVSATPGPEAAADGDPMVITRYLYKPTASEGLTRFNDNRRVHIFVVDVDGGPARQLTDGDRYEHSIAWSPKGDEIAFVSNREADPDRTFNYDLFVLRVGDGSVRRLTDTASAEYHPRWSPDGSTLAYLGTTRSLTSSETTMEDTHVWAISADGSGRRELGGAIDDRQRAAGWGPEGRFVYCTVQRRGSVHLYRLPIDGGEPELVVGERGAVGAWAIATTGDLAYAFTSPASPAELHWKPAGVDPGVTAAASPLTSLNDALLSARALADVEAFEFESFDGTSIQAFLTRPLGSSASSRHPLVVQIHGGPHGQQGPSFNAKAQVYAARGWASLMVNYRGSTGYGQALADAIFGDQNGGEAQDVLAAVDAAIQRYPWIDEARLGVEGGSYGGQLANWIVTQTDRFRAAIPIASISNLISFNYMAYYHDYLAVEFGAYPHERGIMDLLWERSPIRYVGQVKTPVMLVHGENDNDVPIAEAEQFYIALKDVGVETVMVRYPREGHGVRETGHAIDLLERSIAWYERHFADDASPSAP